MHIVLITLLQFLPIAIILLTLSFTGYNRRPLLLCAILYLTFLCQVVILTLPRFGIFAVAHWNWQGKLLGFIWLLILIYPLKLFTTKETGLNLPTNKLMFVYAIFAGVLYNILMLLIELYFYPNDLTQVLSSSNEMLFFQLLMPGLEEELFYRGILWAIITRFLNTRYAFVITTVLFISIHWISINANTQALEWNFWDNYIVVIPAIMFAMARLLSKSIWPGVVMHNVVNGGMILIMRGLSIIGLV